ncbi:MFS sugar transporter [Aspergillus avenaceus]|uniref:MFS sugar transporter n=1 Tax=Aspergillus avenaceus TaxID=36643 RepID=A0A5N6TY33_ASPAV|nr:MFS sugar transporter [Aspergillus avenaceus]
MFSSFTSSSAISNLGSRLRRAITLGDEADDPEHEDCSHISNVLRAYYTEKGRPFPNWLPPDPKAPTPSPARTLATTQIQAGAHGSAPATSYGRGSGGGLSDLWGDSGSPQAPSSQTASLRRGRGTPGGSTGAPLAATNSAPPGSIATPPSQSPAPPSLHPGGGRPLPSQRAGSYQSMSGTGSQGLERATSAQERLRARLHGGRSPSPGQNPNSRPASPYYADPSVRKPVGGRMR